MPNTYPHSTAPNDRWRPVEIIRDEDDGLIAILTEDTSSGRISTKIVREFDRGGKTEQTTYLFARHMPALARLASRLEDRLMVLEDQTRAARRAAP